MKKMIFFILVIGSMAVVGCDKDESISEKIVNYENTIKQKDIEIEQLNKKIDEMKMEIEEFSKTTSTDESKPVDVGERISIAGIRLGYNMEQVAEILGTNYIEEEWMSYGVSNKKWIYEDGLVIYFLSEHVHSIDLTSNEITTDFGVVVGDSAKNALDICSNQFKEFISIHSYDNTPNLGWYITDNDELLILRLNPNEDRFNKDVVIDENTKVEKIELDYASSFD